MRKSNYRPFFFYFLPSVFLWGLAGFWWFTGQETSRHHHENWDKFEQTVEVFADVEGRYCSHRFNKETFMLVENFSRKSLVVTEVRIYLLIAKSVLTGKLSLCCQCQFILTHIRLSKVELLVFDVLSLIFNFTSDDKFSPGPKEPFRELPTRLQCIC